MKTFRNFKKYGMSDSEIKKAVKREIMFLKDFDNLVDKVKEELNNKIASTINSDGD